MPALTHAPAPQLETHRLPDDGRDEGRDDGPGENDNGSGRLPPPDKRTGGNGDGDNEHWNNQPVGSRGPRELLSQFRVGLSFGLGGIALIFITLFVAFFTTRVTGHIDPYNRYINDWLPTPIPSILWLNTAVLLLSSVTAEIARYSMFRTESAMDEWLGLGRPNSNRAGAWMLATTLLGALFLTGQAVAWKQLAAQRVFFSNPSRHQFYILTAAHAFHLLLGFGALVYALGMLRFSPRFLARQIAVDISVWYWHAMGFLWLVLFVLIEYFQ